MNDLSIKDLEFKYNQLLNVAKELFEALDDEARFCIENSEVSENSLAVLSKAEKLGLGKSVALKIA